MSANLDLARSIYADWEHGDYRETDERHILVLVQFRGRTKTSGLELGQTAGRNANRLAPLTKAPARRE